MWNEIEYILSQPLVCVVSPKVFEIGLCIFMFEGIYLVVYNILCYIYVSSTYFWNSNFFPTLLYGKKSSKIQFCLLSTL